MNKAQAIFMVTKHPVGGRDPLCSAGRKVPWGHLTTVSATRTPDWDPCEATNHPCPNSSRRLLGEPSPAHRPRFRVLIIWVGNKRPRSPSATSAGLVSGPR